jgi:hypothetical protein
LSVVVAGMLASVTAQAAPRTWVAGTGTGTVCSRTAPCATLQSAHNATDPGGEINCVDSGEYGGLVITKAITIDCSDVNAGVQTGGINGIVVNAPGAVVTLRGLMIDATGAGNTGVLFHDGAALHVDKCWISGFRTFDAIGIGFMPNAGVNARLDVSDSVITDNGRTAVGGGIYVRPSGTGSARVTLTRVQLENNSRGLIADGDSGTGTTIIQLRDSVVAGHPDSGIHASAFFTTAVVSVTVDRTALVSNGIGVGATGANAFVILGGSTVTQNEVGLESIADGKLFSYRNNQLDGNLRSPGVPVPLIEK